MTTKTFTVLELRLKIIGESCFHICFFLVASLFGFLIGCLFFLRLGLYIWLVELVMKTRLTSNSQSSTY